ncbi:hypothetical protein NEOLEDRAFT_1182934 [Neolentinus lepideus HHB14362 ss-1]|uniref:Uncharacterized protein n=1 Tax=Neolentinus lepideus HHB14362 ss-1 TaxID=1314782 RepID=A0A165NRS6_9AGAM|nr:hypothetical protein NEOLEDRAFT_1182934 [Neolentinus lepideus HHB14362 ss-1]
MGELLTTVQTARRAGQAVSQPTKSIPSLPISIPTPRRRAALPTGSPARRTESSDLLFDMSPVRSTSGLVLPRPLSNKSEESREEKSAARAPSDPLDDLNFVEVSCVHGKEPSPEELFLYTIPTLSKQPSAMVQYPYSQARIKSVSSPYKGLHSQSKVAGTIPYHGRQFRDDGDRSEDEFQASSFDSLSDADRSQPYDGEPSRRSKIISHVKITGFVPSTQKVTPRHLPQSSLHLTPVNTRH